MKKLVGTIFVGGGFILACGALKKGEEEEAAPGPDEGGGEEAPPPAVEKPLAPNPAPQALGEAKVSAQVCAIEGKEFRGTSTSGMFRAITASGNMVVIADEKGQLHGFKASSGANCKLTVDKSFGTDGVLALDNEINWLSAAGDTLVASNGIFASYVIKDGKQVSKCEQGGYVELHGDGKWGIAPWVNSTVKVIEFDDTGCKAEDWVLQNLSDDATRKGEFTNVNSSAVIGDDVLIGGILAKTVNPAEPRVVVAFDKAGKERFRFGGNPDSASPEQFGWVHAIRECKQGICVLDSNYRRLTVWSDAGVYVGTVDLSLLFDLKYPWITAFAQGGGGHAWFATAQQRDDSEVVEGLIYRVDGLADAPAAAEEGEAKVGKRDGPLPGGVVGKRAKAKAKGKAKAKRGD